MFFYLTPIIWMPHLLLNNVSVDFPIYNIMGHSLKNQLMQAATSGRIDSNEKGRVVVGALQNMYLDLKEGDRLGIVGHNGAGKSTLLRVIAGVYKPIEGSIQIRRKFTSMQMRLAFPIATLVQPDIILMDEWLTVGDADFQEKAQRRLHENVEKSSILVIATHSPELVKKICNRTVRLDTGAIVST